MPLPAGTLENTIWAFPPCRVFGKIYFLAAIRIFLGRRLERFFGLEKCEKCSRNGFMKKNKEFCDTECDHGLSVKFIEGGEPS